MSRATISRRFGEDEGLAHPNNRIDKLLIPAFRQISATGIPSKPCFRMNAFCASESLFAFIVFRPSQPAEYRRGKL